MLSVRNFLLCLTTLWFAGVGLAHAQAVREQVSAAQQAGVPHFPAWIRYAGTLTGQLPSRVNLTFSIYSDQLGGQPIWQESQNVELDASGHYSALLGFTSPEGVPPSIFLSSEAQWLGVRVNDAPELPRALVESVPYAMKAQTADTLAGLPASDFVLRSELPRLLQTLDPQQDPAASAPLGEASANFVAHATTVTNPTTVMQSNSSTDVLMVEQDGPGYALHAIGTNAAILAETPAGNPPFFTILSVNHSQGGIGLRAETQAATGRGIGVWGVSYGDAGTGILGETTQATGTSYGVRGKAVSDSGVGVFGVNLSPAGPTTGVRGQTSSPGGTAGVFDAFNGGNILSGRNTGIERFKIDSAGNMTVSGAVTAASFTGDGSRLTNIDAKFLNGFSASSFFNADGATFQKVSSSQLLVNSDSVSSNQFGFAGLVRDDLDTVQSGIGQAGSQVHFRLSRATPDTGGGKDFLVSPYDFGMAIEYPTTIEVWSSDFSVHVKSGQLFPPGTGARFWVGDAPDSGGLFVTANATSVADPGNVVLAADKFTHLSHGSMLFVTRNQNDGFRFMNGALGLEKTTAQLFTTASTSNFEVDAGTMAGTLRADNVQSAVQVGSRTPNRVDIITDDSSPRISVFPSGNVSIGNTGDTASLTVGPSAQFQVSSAGAITIGSGTPILQHISTTGTVSLVSLAAASCQVTNVVATGAADGDTVALGVPSSLAAGGDLVFFGFVSAPDTVSVRTCNIGAASVDNLSGSVRVDVWRH